MAKAGEGDARWIVENRADGTNVHNWHWVEKNILDWSRQRLTELLGDLQLINSNAVSLRTTGVETVTGEAFINNRKNKLIPAYELKVKGTWTGTANESAVSGHFELPYIADENADEDPEVTFTSTSGESKESTVAKQELVKHKEVILAAVRSYVQEVKAGGPLKQGSADSQAAPQQKPSATAPKDPPKAAAAATAAQAQQPRPKQQPKAKAGLQTITLTERFYARPRDLYQCFTDVGRVQAFTQSPAKVEPRQGGAFEIFGGTVIGTFTELQEFNRIALDWRFKNWEDSAVSKVVLEFQEPAEGTTVINLKHTGIPESDRFGNRDVLDNTRIGWQQQIFHKIRAVFGFGL
ncbi:hypothetical protein WJX73_007263 [Symbiochloris irregularis]|uniref:Activator of Hsp90 ATPase AHSA1-like N-terminal domain-containing protein n=1 Tax=Symbiochloris irregularis TaxID=706552 RepID=A0AAW1PRT5_9CHLO